MPDLHQAIAFFVEHVGGELVFLDGPFADDEGDGMTRRLNVHPEATCTLAMVRLGRINLELFEYNAPERSTTQPRNSDIGGTISPSMSTMSTRPARICRPFRASR
ncbi:hypothetical protein [Streptomyces sp. 5-6(2022)]|uniref:hypothetical protein n=1 Tax=Streptomyces sp. 5-6(2022) TaxID=2936510 RepID=UPI0023B8BC44|nr:hypothetical protein [Streptomyces sp. 5-6(2022)]